jgi:C-terminal processing protease CtpA/Prc
MFHRAEVGPLIGKRTWGGLVGIGAYPDLVDGGSITAPSFAFYTPEGKWDIENHGVSPDIEIDLDPKAWRSGHDVQLEKAVNLAAAGSQKESAQRTPAAVVSELSQRQFRARSPDGAARQAPLGFSVHGPSVVRALSARRSPSNRE